MPIAKTPQTDPTAGLRRIGELITGFRGAQVLFTAAALDLFSALRKPSTAAQVAAVRSLDLRACAVLLDALAALGFVVKDRSTYRNAPVAEAALLQDSPASLLHNLRTQQRLAGAWGELATTIRSGRPGRGLMERLWDPGFTRDYILGMAEIAGRPAREVAAILARARPKRLLDVGGGPASFSAALLEAVPGLKADLLDLRGTLAVARRRLRGNPVARRLHLKQGDYRKADFGTRLYDVILLSHVTHDESEAENHALLAKAFRALKPGGCVAVHDFMLDATRTRPLFPALFAVHMLAYTRGGRTYTEGEYASWIREAGFVRLKRHAVCADAPNATVLLIGVKP